MAQPSADRPWKHIDKRQDDSDYEWSSDCTTDVDEPGWHEDRRAGHGDQGIGIYRQV